MIDTAKIREHCSSFGPVTDEYLLDVLDFGVEEAQRRATVPENKNTEIAIKFRGQTYKGLKGPDGLFIGLIGSTRPRGSDAEWREAVAKAGATIPPPSSQARAKRFDEMSGRELAEHGRAEAVEPGEAPAHD
jgi:hypothetical protein